MGDFVLRSEGMTRQQCMQLCYSRQKGLARVKNGTQCMCGDPANGTVTPDKWKWEPNKILVSFDPANRCRLFRWKDGRWSLYRRHRWWLER
jgi:hypothetical protein